MSSTPSAAAPFVAGRYQLRERLGSGAVGDVWSADDPRIGRRVAIKFLRVPDSLSAGQRTEWENRFLLEARAAGRLSHPGIVSIHDVGTASDGRPFIVMEVVEGQNLETLRRADPAPSLERIVGWTIEVAEALDLAHRRGVVHRDIKPANLLVGADGRVRITDFGVARLSESELTRDGAFLGSPAFAAPEQLRGGKVDGRADLFALGAVLYLLCTGDRPFEGNDIAAIAYAACHTEPARPSSRNPAIGPAMDEVILHALHKNPDDRFQTGREFAEALRDAAFEPAPREAPGADDAERTVPDARTHASPTAEDRAVSVASAVAVSIVRGSRAAAEGARRLASACAASARKAAPHARRAGVAIASRARSLSRSAADSGWLASDRSRRRAAMGLFAVAAIAIVAGLAWNRGADAPRRGHVLDRFLGIVGGKSSRVNLVVRHGLEDGTIELSERGESLLREGLSAPKQEWFGVSALAFRSGTEHAAFRLAPGRHELTVDVRGSDGLALAKTLAVQVEPRSEYELQISVATWPRKRIGADWDLVEERGEP